ncbi:MAG TPA: low affinity iron permease family protein [Burkholderiaceae bacterium]|nr:low affinity iron permease family protein [Burkholderiaceae bacterium]
MSGIFHRFAQYCALTVGSSWAFLIACLVIAVWAVTGPLFGYSDTWQLVINTGTSVVTFLMVFIIQNSQNRDAQAMQLKLDELLCAIENARTGLVDLENMGDEEIARLQKEFQRIRRHESEPLKAAEDGATLPQRDEQ